DAGQLVAAQLRDERERDARVPARRLEQLLPGLEVCGVDHRERDPVLDRAGRVVALELGVDANAGRRQLRKLDERGGPDQVEQRGAGCTRSGRGGSDRQRPAAIAGRSTPVESSRTGTPRPPSVRTSSPSTETFTNGRISSPS